jgi:hypothetical protein
MQLPPNVIANGETFPDIERLDRFFKRRLSKASKDAEPAIREEWVSAKERFWGEAARRDHEQQQRKLQEAEAAEVARLAEAEAKEAARKANDEATEQARKLYGSPSAATGMPGVFDHVSAPPAALNITMPHVEVEESQ